MEVDLNISRVPGPSTAFLFDASSRKLTCQKFRNGLIELQNTAVGYLV